MPRRPDAAASPTTCAKETPHDHESSAYPGPYPGPPRPSRTGRTSSATTSCASSPSRGVEVVALQGLDLWFERGEMVAIVGASGRASPTLLNILAGLDVPTAGVARVGRPDLLAHVVRGAHCTTAGTRWASSSSRRPRTSCPTSSPSRTCSCRCCSPHLVGEAGAAGRRDCSRCSASPTAPTGGRRALRWQQQRVALGWPLANRAAGAARRRADRRARQPQQRRGFRRDPRRRTRRSAPPSSS